MRAHLGPHRPESFGFDPAVCWGVHVGGCVEMGPEEVHLQRDIYAHAHTRLTRNSRWKGWICVIDPADVYTAGGNPSRMLLHEYAHLLAGDRAGHGPQWKRICIELGARSEANKYGRAA